MRCLVIDSGLGGLPLLNVLRKNNPSNEYIYIADTNNFPYGNKEGYKVISYIERIALKVKEFDEIFLACNTASSYAIGNLSDYKVKGVIEPVVKHINDKKYDFVTLFATTSTINSNIYKNKLNCELEQFCLDELIRKIEKNESYEITLKNDISNISNNSQALILGCTHFLLIKDYIKKLINIDVICVDELI